MKETGSGQRRGLWAAIIFLCVIGAAVVVRRAVALWPVLMRGYHPAVPMNPVAARFAAIDDSFERHAVLTLIHILPGLLFVTLGPLQFNAKLRARHPMWHRVSGRVFLCAALVIGATAFVMSFAMPAIGGFPQAAATTIFSAYFLFALAKGFWHIRRREFAVHRRWMIRAFSIGIAVATIRPIVALLFATSSFTGLTPQQFFAIAFWIGFVLHLVLTEYWLRNGGRSSTTAVVAERSNLLPS